MEINEGYLKRSLERYKKTEEIFAYILKSEEFKKIVNGVSSETEFIFCGVGKNWYIAEKVTKTFISLGLKAMALDPVHALHGDLGAIQYNPNQVIFFISKSGKTEELVHAAKVVKYLRDKVHKIIPLTVAMTLNTPEDGADPKLYDIVLSISKELKESCLSEFDTRELVPSLSINTIQAVLDCLGVMVYESSKKLVENYKYNHMGGANGKALGADKLLEEIETE